MGLTLIEIVLLSVSTFILFISVCISLRQLCCITRIDHKPKLYKTTFVTVYMTFALILNVMVYALAEYSDYKVSHGLDLFTASYLIEAFLITFAFYLTRILGFAIVEQLYMMIGNEGRPKFITYTLFIAQFAITISAVICYTLGLIIYIDMLYIYIFYIIMSVVILIVAMIFAIVLNTLLKILNEVMLTASNKPKIAASKRAVKGTLIVVICVKIFCILHILSDLQTMYHYLRIKWDDTLANAVLHSAFLITVGAAFMLLVFDYKKELFKIHKHSICRKLCGKKKKKKKKKNTQSAEMHNDKHEPLLRKNTITDEEVVLTIND
eukprot:450009_1